MSKIYSQIPTYAHYKASIEKPENWDAMSQDEKQEYFFNNHENEASLCHQCSGDTECEFEPADDVSIILHFSEGEE